MGIEKTERNWQILRLVEARYSKAQIGRMMQISATRVSQIYDKLVRQRERARKNVSHISQTVLGL
jgi:ATP/maltotriose-dependent transcriptional regulator MalT